MCRSKKKKPHKQHQKKMTYNQLMALSTALFCYLKLNAKSKKIKGKKQIKPEKKLSKMY